MFVKIFLLLALFPFSLSATDCQIQGIIINVGAGTSVEQAPDGNGGMRKVDVIFTQLTMDITKNSCAGSSLIKYGLCQDIDLYIGDKLKATAKDWNYGGKCLDAVIKLDK